MAIIDHLHLIAEEVETEISPALANGPDDNSFLPSPPPSSSADQSNRLLLEEEKEGEEQKDVHLSEVLLPQSIAVEEIPTEADSSINQNEPININNTTSHEIESVEKERIDMIEDPALGLSLAESSAVEVPALLLSNPITNTEGTTTNFEEGSAESSVLFPQVNSPSMEVSVSHSMMLSPRLNAEEDKPTLEEKHDSLLTPSPLSTTSHRFVFDLDQGGNSAFASPPLHVGKALGSSHSGKLTKAPSNMSTFSMMSNSKSNTNTSNILPPISSYAASFNKLAQTLREYLLRECGGGQANHKEILEDAMRLIDENGSGVVTSTEILSFLQSSQLNSLFVDVEEANRDKFCQLLLEQIDCNR